MDQKQSIALWKQGKDAWNKWAKKMLAAREVLEQTGQWKVEANLIGHLKGQNQPTKDWIEKARVDFSSLWLRPHDQPEGGSDKEKARDHKSIVLDQSEVDFRGFIFPCNADFSNSIFDCGSALFTGAEFSGGQAVFQSSQFSDGSADFSYAQFNGGRAFFFNAQFNGGNALFSYAQFNGGDAFFSNAQFNGGSAFFSRAKFSHGANFSLAQFKHPASFQNAIFKENVNFSSITSEKSFDLTHTEFSQAPDFTENAFHAPPVLDDITIPDPLKCRMWNWHDVEDEPRHSGMNPFKITNDKTDSRKYRALSKMADEAKDYQNEMEFFAREQRCRRFWHDRPFGKGAGRFWFGLAYEKFSNFGRSFLRPFIGWSATMAIFATYYGFQAKNTGHIWDSIYLSLRHGLVISGLTKNGHMTSLLKKMYCTDIPAFAFMLQPFISAILIFLLLLALRNQFKIR